MADNTHVMQEFVSSVIMGEAFADASLLRSPSDLLSSYDLVAYCSTTLRILSLERLYFVHFLVPSSCFV